MRREGPAGRRWSGRTAPGVRRSAAARLTALLIGALLPLLASAQQFEITLAAQPPQGKRYGTRADGLTLTVQAGQRVLLEQRRGRDYATHAGAGLLWTPLATPRDADALALRPMLRDDGRVEVEVEMLRRAGDRQARFSSTVLTPPGEWTRLYAPAGARPESSRSYSTAEQRRDDSLYLYLHPQAP